MWKGWMIVGDSAVLRKKVGDCKFMAKGRNAVIDMRRSSHLPPNSNFLSVRNWAPLLHLERICHSFHYMRWTRQKVQAEHTLIINTWSTSVICSKNNFTTHSHHSVRCIFSFFMLFSSSCFCLPRVQFAKKYGDIFSLRLFGGQMIVISGYKRVREALVEKGEDFVDRPSIPLFEETVGNRGGDFTFILHRWFTFLHAR